MASPTAAAVDDAIRVERGLIRRRMRPVDVVGALILAVVVPLLIVDWTGTAVAIGWGAAFAGVSALGLGLGPSAPPALHHGWIAGLGLVWGVLPLLVWSDFGEAGTAIGVLTLIVLAMHALNLSLYATSLWFAPSIAMSVALAVAAFAHGSWGLAVLVLVFAGFALSGGQNSDSVFRRQVRSTIFERFLRARYEREATHDALTGLPNRRYMTSWLEEHASQTVTVAVIDFDDFKRVNETWDHIVGDAALRAVAAGLSTELAGWTIARTGGDEFAAFVVGRVDVETLGPFPVGTLYQGVPLDLEISVSCGVTSGVPAKRRLLSEAEFALGHAKRDKGTVVVMSTEVREAFRRRQHLASVAAEGLPMEAISAWGQPSVKHATGDVLGVELLARWDHPEFGHLGPPDFLPAIAASNRQRELFGHMLGLALGYITETEGSWGGWVSVNLEAEICSPPGLAAEVVERVASIGIPPDRLMIEIVATGTSSNQQAVRRAIGELVDAGIRVALDDFGTEQFSLHNLSRVPTDFKLAGHISSDDRSIELARAIVAIAESQGTLAIAKGIDDEHAAARAVAAGVPALQGDWIEPAAPIADVALDRSPRRPEAQ